MFSKSQSTSLINTTSIPEHRRTIASIKLKRTPSPGHESDCALSLLSSLQTQSSGIGFNQAEQDRHLISFLQPLDVSLGHHNRLETASSVLNGCVSNADMNCSGMFHAASNDGGNEAPPPSLPFHWQ
ncbi:hypothetical protein SDJN03_14797, partial [Cucurbita argyrosperma subsp. sororia]